MTKAELIEELKSLTGEETSKLELFVERFCKTVIKATASGNQVTIRGFGTFGLKQRKAKIGRDIGKNEPVNIPAKKIMKFTPSKYFQMAVDKLQNNL